MPSGFYRFMLQVHIYTWTGMHACAHMSIYRVVLERWVWGDFCILLEGIC